jgi:aspartyl protease family protein
MWRYLLLAVSLLSVASYGPAMFEKTLAERKAAAGAPASAKPAVASEATTLAGGKVRIESDGRGHFIAKARMNGRPMEVLVDTGATAIAITKSTARRLGLKLAEKDFRHKVKTANGETSAALATIDTVEIGKIRVQNVEAIVLADSDLSATLLGMSFLNRLARFEVSGGALLMVQ